MTIGQKIKEFRKEAGLTQKQLAKDCGVAEITIRQYEADKRQPRYEQLQIIAKALDISLSDFLDDDYFDAITDPDLPEDYEENFLDAKLQSIIDNTELNDEEKAAQLQEYIAQTEIMADMHMKNAEGGNRFLLNAFFDQLNLDGQSKAIEQVEMLTKIPEYQKENTPAPSPTDKP